MERYGHPDRVDPRSYEEQGLDKTATVHLSRYAYELEQRGIATYKRDINRAINAENRYREEAKRVMAQIDKAIEERRQLEVEKIKAGQPTKSVDFEDRYKSHVPQHTTRTSRGTESQLTYRKRNKQSTHRYHKREEAGQGKNMKEESPPLTVGERYKQAMERQKLVRDPDRPSKSYRKPADRYKEAMERKKPSMHDIIEETKRKLEEEKRHHEPEQHHKDKDNGRER